MTSQWVNVDNCDDGAGRTFAMVVPGGMLVMFEKRSYGGIGNTMIFVPGGAGIWQWVLERDQEIAK